MAMNRKTLSSVGAAAVVVGLAGAGYLFLQHTHRAKASAPRPPRGGRAGRRRRRPEAERAADRARHRHGAGLQHGGHQDARRRRDRQGGLPAKARTSRRAIRSSRSIRGRSRRRSTRRRRPSNATRRSSPSAQLDLERYGTLSKEGFQSRQSFDEQTAIVRALKGSIAADEAAIANARLNLDYADIRAPFDGRTGTRLVDIGNLVQAARRPAWSASPRSSRSSSISRCRRTSTTRCARSQAAGALAVIACGERRPGRAGAAARSR